MNTLIALGTAAAYLYSLAVTIWPGVFATHHLGLDVYYDTSAMIITFILLGRWLEAKARGRASDAIRRLMSLAPPTARVRRDGIEQEIPLSQVRKGDLRQVRPRKRRSSGRLENFCPRQPLNLDRISSAKTWWCPSR